MNVISGRDQVPTTGHSNCYSNAKDASAIATNGLEFTKEATTMERKGEDVNRVHRRGFSCDEAEDRK
ncbi:MAG: hypothetical protein GY861_06530 [bacterium]|nr:hypothetical protein [bacterium]